MKNKWELKYIPYNTKVMQCYIICCSENILLFLDEGYVKMYLKGRPITMYMPKELVDTYCLEGKADLPPKKLKLDWVYPFALQQNFIHLLVFIYNQEWFEVNEQHARTWTSYIKLPRYEGVCECACTWFFVIN